MKHIISLVLWVILTLFVSQQSLAAPVTIDDFDFYTEKYPPYNFRNADGDLTGIAVDLLQKTLVKMGSTKSTKFVNVLAWYESYQSVLTKNNTMLFSAVRNASREHLFKWAGPIDGMSGVLLVKKTSHIPTLKSVAEMKKYKLGSIIEDSDTQILVDLGIKKDDINLANNGNELLYMLDNGQVDAIAYSLAVLKWLVQNNQGSFANYEIVYNLQQKDLYYAFNINTDDELVKQFQAALDSLKVENKGLKSDYTLIKDKYVK